MQGTKSEGETRELKAYTREEVASHNKMDDAWVIVDGFVYDITPCLRNGRHTEQMVSRDLGRDISLIFKQIHSQRAKNMLIQRRIGVLAGLRGPSSVPSVRPSSASSTDGASGDFKEPDPPRTRLTVTSPMQ